MNRKPICRPLAGHDATHRWSRRHFLGGALAATAAAALPGGVPSSISAPLPSPVEGGALAVPLRRKIKLGLVGCGGRGSWIAKLFQQHGGYEFHAVADYFQEVADTCGDSLGVDKARRFSTLSGYKRVIESGAEAVVLEAPPGFFPEHASAAVQAGLHVYMAKPVAVDVPGCLQIEATGHAATQGKQCFLVDYQMPTDPANQEVLKRIGAEGFGKLAQIFSVGTCHGFSDPPKTKTIESRLRGLVWVNDAALGGDYIGNYDIHAIDAALWVIGQRPTAAMGASRICRRAPHGDGRDVCSVIFEYANGVVHNHFGQGLPNHFPGELSCRVHGQTGNALLTYWGNAQLRSFDDQFSGSVDNLYEAGAVRNIAAFYRNITEGDHRNVTVRRSVDGALATVLGREAAARQTRLTMDQLLKENKRLEIDLTGLKT
jgi:myo-inositol 2-dehydrogenase / D-chiro-inositol 1-dehydrogenase